MPLAVGATWLDQITVAGGRVVEQEWSGMWGTQIEAPLPQLVAAHWPDFTGTKVPRPISVGLLLTGDTPAAFNSLMLAVQAVVETTGTVLLTRKIETLDGFLHQTAYGVYLGGMDPTMRSHAAGVVVPRWQMLDAEWR